MNAVIYARYSSDNQREESIEGQLRECNDTIESIVSLVMKIQSEDNKEIPLYEKQLN